MKKLVFGIIATVIVLLVMLVFIFHSKPSTNSLKSPSESQSSLTTSSTNSATSCSKNQLSATMAPEGAAGNIYAKLEIENIGDTPCIVTLGNSITASFDANNIVIQNQLHGKKESFTLPSGGKVFSQIHYQNGPQCSTKIIEKQVTIIYKTDQISLPFTSTFDNKSILTVPSCTSFNEKTNIDIWPLTKNPISS